MIVASVALVAGFAAVPIVVSSSASAADIKNCVSQGTGVDNLTVGENCTPAAGEAANGASLSTIAKKVVNFMSVIVGVVAVVMIIVGGFKYVTSGGDSNKISSAKNTIIYALIGLIIVALSQFIVQFILRQAAGVGPEAN
jgi:uncharacterized membrane protein